MFLVYYYIFYLGGYQKSYLAVFDKSETPYSLVDIDINLSRKTLYYTFNFIIPNIMIAILSIAGFVLPPESGEKIGLR